MPLYSVVAYVIDPLMGPRRHSARYSAPNVLISVVVDFTETRNVHRVTAYDVRACVCVWIGVLGAVFK